MKTPKLLKQVQKFLDSSKKKQCEHRDSIKSILKKLKKKQRLLKAKLAKERNGNERKKIQQDLTIIFAQRKKGLKVLKKIRDREC